MVRWGWMLGLWMARGVGCMGADPDADRPPSDTPSDAAAEDANGDVGDVLTADVPILSCENVVRRYCCTGTLRECFSIDPRVRRPGACARRGEECTPAQVCPNTSNPLSVYCSCTADTVTRQLEWSCQFTIHKTFPMDAGSTPPEPPDASADTDASILDAGEDVHDEA